MRHIFCLFATLLVVMCPALSAERQVALELVLAVDTSTSVDETEFRLQRDGLASAFSHPDLLAVIEAMGETGIAVTMIEWAGTDRQAVVVPWTLVNDTNSALRFAARLQRAPRLVTGLTDIGSILRYSTRQIAANRFQGRRKVIDVSGDGSSNVSGSKTARDNAVSQGITVNGLVILKRNFDLGAFAEIDIIQHYTNSVIGGNGAFLMVAQGFEDFQTAMRKKLIREMLGNGLAYRDEQENANQVFRLTNRARKAPLAGSWLSE